MSSSASYSTSSAAPAVVGLTGRGVNDVKGDVAPPDSPSKHAFLKKKPVIGAAGTQQTFPKGDSAFHSLDMPPTAAKARFQVQEMLRLARSEKAWNASSYVEKVPCERMQKTNSAFDPTFSGLRYNFRAEKLTESLPVEKDVFGRVTGYAKGAGKLNRTSEMPSNAAVESKPEWEVRTRELSLGSRPMERRLETVTKAALEATTKRGRQMLASTGYTSPIKRESEYMEQLRETRRAEAEAYVKEQVEALEGSLAQPYQGGFHNSFALLESKRARARSAGLMGLTSTTSGAGAAAASGTGGAAGGNADTAIGRTSSSSALRSLSNSANVTRKYKHTGAFGPVAHEVAALGGKGLAWSCCGNEDQGSAGCVAIVINKNARCFAGL